MLPKPKRKRMYAVSLAGVGLIAGTLGYSRAGAIQQFLGKSSQTWPQAKHAGYRTVLVCVEVFNRGYRSRKAA